MEYVLPKNREFITINGYPFEQRIETKDDGNSCTMRWKIIPLKRVKDKKKK